MFNSSSYIFLTPENTLGGTLVGRFEAMDRDLGESGELLFIITGPNSDRYILWYL